MTNEISEDQIDKVIQETVSALEKNKHLYAFDTVNGSITLDNGMILVLDYAAHCNFEDIAEGEILDMLLAAMKDKKSLPYVPRKLIRAGYYVAAKRHQPNITLEEAGDLVQKYPDALFYAELASKGETIESLKGKLEEVLKKTKEMMVPKSKPAARKKAAKTTS